MGWGLILIFCFKFILDSIVVGWLLVVVVAQVLCCFAKC
jgi:hypothetical protein